MKNKLLLLLLICLIAMPCVGELTKNKVERAEVIKKKNAEAAKNKKNGTVVVKNRTKTKTKKSRTSVKRKKSTENKNRNVYNVTKKVELNINARVLFASKNISKNLIWLTINVFHCYT